ncbi:ISL3 family transposase [Conexibacter sp. S30A1]|uniref:ISL3 family transposase n=1 Tax=Conexibacter sp. S30A1 TaxID=2937800 RepID=UPI0035313CBD
MGTASMQAQDLSLFQAALGLSDPWQVTGVEFDADAKRLDLRVDFEKGARLPCPECDRAGLKVHDTEEKTWRHLDFFQHQAYLTARVPRVECPEHKVRLVAVPWARPRSGFTLLFEALVMAMVREMPVATLAGLVGESDMRIWRIVHHYVDLAVDAQNLEGVSRVGIDETSSRRGQDYVTVFADLDERRGVFVVEGRDHETVQAFSLFLETHGGDPPRVSEVCQDMSEAFLKGTLSYLPKAEITFDRYHVKSHLSAAVDEVRREEAKHHKDLLRNTRYMWLKRPANLTGRQRDLLDELLTQPLDTVRAYTLAQQSGSFYELADPDTAEEYLRRWITEVDATDLEPLHKFARMLEDHWLGVIRWHHSRVSNGLLEGLNSLIQAAKRRARGYRSNRNFIAMIYLIVGKLNAGPVTA